MPLSGCSISNGRLMRFVASATAPFVQADDLRRGLLELQAGTWAYAFTVTEYTSPIFRAFRKYPDGGIEMLFPDEFTSGLTHKF